MIVSILKKYKILVLILMPIYIGVFLFAVMPSKYALTLPGGIKAIDSEIIIPSTVDNDFYSVYVMAYDHPTYLQVVLSRLSIKNDIYIPEYKESLKTSFESGTLFKNLSYTNALITAYEAASLIDHEITIDYHTLGYVVTFSINTLKINDIITHIDGLDVLDMSYYEITDYLKNHDQVNMTILRNKQPLMLTLHKKDGLYGIGFELLREIKKTTPAFSTTTKTNSTFGPSGGLMQALSIYASLLNIDYPMKIAGSGTINADDRVGSVGGVQQKIYTVNGLVDIFLIGTLNYQEALQAYQTLKNPTFKLYEVENFNDAITILKSEN